MLSVKFNLNMSSAQLFRLTLVVCACFKVVAGVTECTAVDKCSCKFDDGSMMDLTSLGNTDNTPRFNDVKSTTEDNFYSYNPCGGFSERACQKAATCISNPTKEESIQIGDASSAKFKYDTNSGHVVAAYTSGKVGGVLRLSEVVLVCDKSATSATFEAQGMQEGGFFLMTLTTVCACPGGCSSSGPTGGGAGGSGSSSGISVGSIILIGFFTLMIIYIGVGTVLLKFVKKKEGAEVFPNIVFWKTIPALIKIRDWYQVYTTQQYDDNSEKPAVYQHSDPVKIFMRQTFKQKREKQCEI